MLRFKSFSGAGQDLQQQINRWLEEYDPDVRQMVQTPGTNGFTISFLFEEGFRGHEMRLTEEHGMRRAADPVASLEEIPGRPLEMSEESGGILPADAAEK